MLKTIFFLSFISVLYFTGNSCFAQTQLTASELNTVQKLIKEKHDLESNNELKSTYKLQIFSSGSLEEAKQTQQEFEALGHEIESKIIYQTPNYKVWVGNFRNRIQADRANEKIKSEYPNILIIRPGK
jgi:hypothetical protein